MARDHQAGGMDGGAVGTLQHVTGGLQSHRCQPVPEQSQGMTAEAETQMLVIGQDLLAFRRRLQHGNALGEAGLAEQRRRLLHASGIPMGAVTVAGQRFQRPGAGQHVQLTVAEPRPFRQFPHGPEGVAGPSIPGPAVAAPNIPAPGVHQPLRSALRQALDPVESQPQHRPAGGVAFQRRLPVAAIDIHRTDFHPMLPGASHQLGRGVEAHGLAVEQRTEEHRRLMTLEPGRNIDQQRKARGVGLREPVVPEALDLIEYPLGEFRRITTLGHARLQAALEAFQPAPPLPGRHGPAQTVRFARRETRRHHGDLHDLFLEDGDPQRSLQNLLDLGTGIGDGILAVAPPEIGMNHVALDGPRPDDGHLDDQIVIAPGLQARQHGHLRPGLDLEHPHRVGLADHVVDRRILRRKTGHGELAAVKTADQLETAANRAQHPQAKHIHLQQAQVLQVVLVPLDDGAVLHGCILDGDQLAQRPPGNDESANVLGQVAGKPRQLLNQAREPPDDGRPRIESRLADLPRGDLFPVPPLHRLGQDADLRFFHPQGLAHVADRAAGPIADHRSGQRGAFAGIFAVDVLNDLLAALVFEIHVDVGRLVPLPGNEPLHEHFHACGIHFGDAQAETDGRIGRRAASLAKDAPAAGKPDDVVNGEEVGLVAKLADELQFVFDEPPNPGRRAFRPAPAHALLGEVAQVAGGRRPFRNQFAGILVTQFVQGEIDALGDRERLLQQAPGIDSGKFPDGPQEALAVGIQPEAHLLQRLPAANGGERILQPPALAAVHVDVAAGEHRQTQFCRNVLPPGQQCPVLPRHQQFRGQPQAAGETFLEPGAFPQDCRRPRRPLRRPLRQPQDQAFGRRQITFEIVPGQAIGALFGRPPRVADERRERPVGGAIRRQHDGLHAVLQTELAADDEFEGQFLRCRMSPHHTGQGALVGQRQGRITQFGGPLHLLPGM